MWLFYLNKNCRSEAVKIDYVKIWDFNGVDCKKSKIFRVEDFKRLLRTGAVKIENKEVVWNKLFY